MMLTKQHFESPKRATLGRVGWCELQTTHAQAAFTFCLTQLGWARGHLFDVLGTYRALAAAKGLAKLLRISSGCPRVFLTILASVLYAREYLNRGPRCATGWRTSRARRRFHGGQGQNRARHRTARCSLRTRRMERHVSPATASQLREALAVVAHARTQGQYKLLRR